MDNTYATVHELDTASFKLSSADLRCSESVPELNARLLLLRTADLGFNWQQLRARLVVSLPPRPRCVCSWCSTGSAREEEPGRWRWSWRRCWRARRPRAPAARPGPRGRTIGAAAAWGPEFFFFCFAVNLSLLVYKWRAHSNIYCVVSGWILCFFRTIFPHFSCFSPKRGTESQQ